MIKINILPDKKLRIAAIIVVVSMVCVIVIKGIIRPLDLHFSKVNEFFMGTLPNFFAATGFSSFFFVFSKLLLEKRLKTTISRLNFSSIITFSCLTLWEVIQKLMGNPMDLFDILMTGIGCICTWFFIFFIYRKEKN